MKNAAAGRIHGAWHFARNHLVVTLPLNFGIRNRHRVKQRLGVRVFRVVEQLVPVGQFH